RRRDQHADDFNAPAGMLHVEHGELGPGLRGEAADAGRVELEHERADRRAAAAHFLLNRVRSHGSIDDAGPTTRRISARISSPISGTVRLSARERSFTWHWPAANSSSPAMSARRKPRLSAY